MSNENEILESFEEIPEVKQLLARIRGLETKIQKQVCDETWNLMLEWEAMWAQYVTLVATMISQQQRAEN